MWTNNIAYRLSLISGCVALCSLEFLYIEDFVFKQTNTVLFIVLVVYVTSFQ